MKNTCPNFGELTDESRIEFMIGIGVIEKEWREDPSWPISWDPDVMRSVVDYAYKLSKRKK